MIKWEGAFPASQDLQVTSEVSELSHVLFSQSSLNRRNKEQRELSLHLKKKDFSFRF